MRDQTRKMLGIAPSSVELTLYMLRANANTGFLAGILGIVTALLAPTLLSPLLVIASVQMIAFIVILWFGKLTESRILWYSMLVFELVALVFGVYTGIADLRAGNWPFAFSILMLASTFLIARPVLRRSGANAVACAVVAIFLAVDSSLSVHLAGELAILWVVSCIFALVRYNECRTNAEAELKNRGNAQKQVETDPLTGLPTFISFRKTVENLLEDPNIAVQYSLVYFDIENFKAFNHQYGMEVGDELLRTLAQLLADEFNDCPTAHFTEDRFVVFAPNLRISNRVQRVHDELHDHQRDVSLELKAGVCQFSLQERNVSVAIERAELACASVKGRYDLACRFFDGKLSSKIERQNHIIASLSTALENGYIEVHYQPVIRVQTRNICGAEALARWRDPSYGLLTPFEFIETLESHRLIHLLDLHIIEQVAQTYAQRARAGQVLMPISVNLSRIDFYTCDVVRRIEEISKRYDMPPTMLNLEVTESAFSDNSDVLSSKLQELRALGYQVWMDDFGSGYSSLNLLKEFEFDQLKLDMAFLRDFESHDETRVIIAAIVDMAKQLGIRTLAEGVETREHLEFLQHIGCEKAQGYFISKPVLLDELEAEGTVAETFGYEPLESRAYFDATSTVNLISPNPLGTSKGTERVEGNMPLAVIEWCNHEMHYLSSNGAYQRLLESIEINEIDEAKRFINEEVESSSIRFEPVCMEAMRTGKEANFDHITNGRHCNTRVTYLASDKRRGAHAFLARTLSLTEISDTRTDSLAEEALRATTSIYTRVDLISETGDYVENIYLNASRYRGDLVRDSLANSLDLYAQHNVHADDRERFLTFYDMSTVRQRLAKGGVGHLSTFLRSISADGGYTWQLYVLIPMARDGKRYYLSCTRDIDASVMQTVPESRGMIPEIMLWESMVQTGGIGLFWKDRARRFVGANQQFLDYYGFDSMREIVGKTDEEMRWHIDPEPFMQDEQHLLETGEAIVDAVGTCLARGKVHIIVANKMPVWDGNEVIGLVGYFREASESERDRYEKAGGSDLPAQLLGEYRRARETRGIDFETLDVFVGGYAHCCELRGEEFGEHAIEQLIHTARENLGAHGIVLRTDDAHFTVVQQLYPEDAPGELEASLRNTLSQVNIIDGTPFDPKLSIEYSLNSA